MQLSSNTPLIARDGGPDSKESDDFLTPVIDSTIEKLTASGPGVGGEGVVCEGGEGVEAVVESGPVQYDDGEEGLDDEELEELAYEDDPLLHSDYEDEGGWGTVVGYNL